MEKVFARLAIGVVAMTLLAALAAFPAAAAGTYTLTPSTFVGTAAQCGGTPGTPGGVVARWDTTVGNPAPSLDLEKNVPTTDCSSAGAMVNGVSGVTLTELNFDVMGYCGAGAPRFNVTTTAGNTYFFGCAHGTHTDLGNGWTHVVFSPADASPQNATNPPFTSAMTVQSIELIQDEQGQTHLDNISINNQVITGPATPASADACKNGGWQNLQDANGQTFRNQGQCVSSFNHLNGRGNDDVNGDDNGGNGNGKGKHDGD